MEQFVTIFANPLIEWLFDFAQVVITAVPDMGVVEFPLIMAFAGFFLIFAGGNYLYGD